MRRQGFVLVFCLLLPACASLSKTEGKFLPAEHPSSFHREVLENGLTVLLKENHQIPLVSLMAYVKTGSAHEGEWTGSGISHALEHMLFKGTETKGVGEIEREIRSYGGDINAFTSQDVTGYTLVVGRDHYGKALALLADCLKHARLDGADFEKEKEVILSEIRLNRDSPSRRISKLLWENVFRSHPYRYPVIGYDALLKALTREDLARYYRQRYVANNTILSLVGDFKKEEALKSIRDHFQSFERKSLPPEPKVLEPPQRGMRELQEIAPIQIAHLVMGYRTVNVTDAAMAPLDVLAILLGEGESSRLVATLLKKRELVVAIESSHYTPQDPGLFSVFAVLEKEKIPETVRAIREEIERTKRGSFSETELQKAKRKVLADYYFGQETLQSQAAILAENEAVALNPLFSEQYVRAVAAVTPEDVRAASERYLTEENLTLVTLVPESSEEVTQKKISPSRKEGEIRRIVLPNGIRVLLKEDGTQPTVSLCIALLGGLRFEEASNQGISNFVSRMFSKGTSRRTEKEISDWIDAHGASFAPFSGQNSLGLRLKLLKVDAAEGVRLLSEMIQSPSFPEEEVEKERHLILGELKAERDQIFKVGERYLRRTLYTRHPYRFTPLGIQESITRLSRNDLLTFYKNILSTERMVIAAFGEFHAGEIAEVIQKNFSALPERKAMEREVPNEPPIQESRLTLETLPKEQALLLVGFHGISFKDDDYYPFEVLTGVLSGGGGKLYSEIRDKSGQAYTLGAYPVWGLDPGYYVFYVATTPEELPDVHEKILSEIEGLSHTLIPAEEIERTQESLIGLQKLSLQTPDALSFQVALDELYGLDYHRYLRYEEKIRSVTAEDLLRIASTTFNPAKKAVILINSQGSQKKE